MDRSRGETHVRLALAVCAGVLALAALGVFAESTPPASELERASARTEPTQSPRAIPPTVGGLKTYRDPVTGERRSPPPGLPAPRLSVSERRALRRSHEGLVAVSGQTPAGGTRVDLQGRFLSNVVARVGADGTASMGCLDDLPDALRGK